MPQPTWVLLLSIPVYSSSDGYFQQDSHKAQIISDWFLEHNKLNMTHRELDKGESKQESLFIYLFVSFLEYFTYFKKVESSEGELVWPPADQS